MPERKHECFTMQLKRTVATLDTGGVAMFYSVHACNVAIFDE